MPDITMPDAYGIMTAPDMLKIQRLLPGPIERVWSYLTDGDLRRQWLASGDMQLAPDTPFELVWRNDELTDPPGERPDGFGEEHRMMCRMLEAEPPTRLVFAWGTGSEVVMELETRGESVLLTLVHRRLVDRQQASMVGPGWHAHLDILKAKLEGRQPAPFWDAWSRLKPEYDGRIPG